MKTLLFSLLLCLVLSLISGLITIPILRKIKAGQPIYKYVDTHKEKNGTPTMGGLFFIIPSAILFFILRVESSYISVVATTIGLAFMAVGFIDDFIKIKFKKNEGLKPYQKIIFQLSIAVVSGIFVYKNGLTIFHVPFINEDIDLGAWSIVVVAVIFIAMTNSVNLTDGLDGLASSVSIVYLLSFCALIFAQMYSKSHLYLIENEYYNLVLLSVCLIGGLMGFLVFNTNKASVFMGDTGSLSLGGFLAAISIFSSNAFFIPVIGIMFVTSSISVIVQVLYFKKTKKRVFLMAPLHHHFQLKGKSESKIVAVYSTVTAFMGVLSIALSI